MGRQRNLSSAESREMFQRIKATKEANIEEARADAERRATCPIERAKT